MADSNNNSLLDIANNGAMLNQALSDLTTNLENLANIKLPVANGGTGQSSLTSNSVLTGNGTNGITSETNFVCTDAGNVGIGTASPSTVAALDVTSTTRGVLFPRMTTGQRDAISSPPNGLVVYNSTTNKLQVRAAGVWVDLH